MARVCLAVTGSPPVFCVVKRPASIWRDDPKMLARFKDEATISIRLHHPNIVNTFDAGDVLGRPYIAQEYLAGRNVEALRRSSGNADVPLFADVSLLIAREAAAALAYAHSFEGLGLVHRDVSPTNIHVGYGGQVKLLDFGLAKWDAKSLQTKTGEGGWGKALYMPPEQLADRHLDARTDVYALGIVLWELLSNKIIGTVLQDGKAIPPREGIEALAKRIRDEPLLRPSLFNPDVSPSADALVLRAAAKNPEDRFPSAAAMRDAIDQVLQAPTEARSELVRMMQAFPERVERQRREGLAAAAQTLLDETLAEWQSQTEKKAPSISKLPIAVAGELGHATTDADKTPSSASLPPREDLEEPPSPDKLRGPSPPTIQHPIGGAEIRHPGLASKDNRQTPKRPLANITPGMRHIQALAGVTVPAHHGRRVALVAGALALVGGTFWLSHRAQSPSTATVVPGTPPAGPIATRQSFPSEPPSVRGIKPIEQPAPSPGAHAPSVTNNQPWTTLREPPEGSSRSSSTARPAPKAAGRKPRGLAMGGPPSSATPLGVAPEPPVAQSGNEPDVDAAPSLRAREAIKEASEAFDAADYDLAIAAGKRALAAGGGGDAHSVIGRAYFAKHMFVEAGRELRAAIKMDPSDKESRRRLEWLRENDHREVDAP
jgi:serine/threonine protein kinase